MLAYADVSITMQVCSDANTFTLQQRCFDDTWPLDHEVHAWTAVYKGRNRTHTASGLEERTSYCFRLCASNIYGESPFSPAGRGYMNVCALLCVLTLLYTTASVSAPLTPLFLHFFSTSSPWLP